MVICAFIGLIFTGELTLSSLFEAFVLVASAALIGFSFRSQSIRKSKKRILQLENEMLNNHARILSLEKINAEIQKENTQLKSRTPRRSSEQIEFMS